MNRRRLKRDIKAEINIVPFLDVLLVLLLVFMATAPVISQSVEVDLPKDKYSQSATTDVKAPIILQVENVGRYKIKVDGSFIQLDGRELLTAQEVINHTTSALKKDSELLFLIAGDSQVPYEEVIKGISLLKDAGVKTVGLMTAAQ